MSLPFSFGNHNKPAKGPLDVEITIVKESSLDLLLKEKEVKEVKEFDPNDGEIIRLDSLNDKSVANSFKNQLCSRGWCFVDLLQLKQRSGGFFGQSENPVSIMLNPNQVKEVETFFQSSQDKKSYSLPNLYGYSAVDHKESFHYLSDRRNPGMKSIPFHFLDQLSGDFDNNLALDLVEKNE
eukprot:TRINITY_DN3091_c0_g3_i3.p2 TRINITY_DN3091_c0_g3~~TRINITY_DN3091_c0_g3_i3.p2  ORF type:complete len:181 (-),score=58.47 TRINITY_DN3091_c0_g3_i3:670-1212(-)